MLTFLKRKYYTMVDCLASLLSAFYLCQGRIQGLLRPGCLLPFMHCHKERWVFKSGNSVDNKDQVLGAVLNVISQDRVDETWKIIKIDGPSGDNAHGGTLLNETVFVKLYVYTRFKLQDVIEITFKGEVAEVRSFCSGFLPVFIPFAFILNMLLFWLPFPDCGRNKKRLKKIVHMLGNDVTCMER